jgi:hypothetical protein
MSKFFMVMTATLAVAFAGMSNASAEDCSSMKGARKGTASIRAAMPGDWAKVELICGGTVLNSCTATVAAGATSATCTFAATALTKGTYQCKSTNSPRKGSASGGTCTP